MGAASPAATYPRSPRILTWWANHSHRYVLPVVGVASVSLGLSLAIDGQVPWRSYAPDLLVAVGASALASGLGALAVRRYHRARSSARAETSPVRAPEVAPRVPPVAGAPAPRGPSAWDSTPSARIPLAMSDSSVTIPSDPGDFLWGSWASPKGHLPVELVGPVRETAYLPPVPGAPVLYEEGDLVFLNPPTVPTASASRPPTFEATAAVRSGSLATSEILVRGGEATAALRGWADSATVRGGPSYAGTSFPSSVHYEAANPTPPHLRRNPSSPDPTLPRRRSPGHTPERGVRCANCREPVSDPPKWRRCLDCQRHLCGDCVVSALLTYQRGWCSECAEFRRPEGLTGAAVLAGPTPAGFGL